MKSTTRPHMDVDMENTIMAELQNGNEVAYRTDDEEHTALRRLIRRGLVEKSQMLHGTQFYRLATTR